MRLLTAQQPPCCSASPGKTIHKVVATGKGPTSSPVVGSTHCRSCACSLTSVSRHPSPLSRATTRIGNVHCGRKDVTHASKAAFVAFILDSPTPLPTDSARSHSRALQHHSPIKSRSFPLQNGLLNPTQLSASLAPFFVSCKHEVHALTSSHSCTLSSSRSGCAGTKAHAG